ncbi:MAG: hypothetical protein V5788_00495 [Shewanella sp.]
MNFNLYHPLKKAAYHSQDELIVLDYHQGKLFDERDSRLSG